LTVLDGEYVYIPKYGKFLYLAFDILFFQGKDVRNEESLKNRLLLTAKALKDVYSVDMNIGIYSSKDADYDFNKMIEFNRKNIINHLGQLNKSLKEASDNQVIYSKYFIFPMTVGNLNDIYALSTLLYEAYTLNAELACPYILDGLIYTPLNQKYTRNQREIRYKILKWKPDKNNSIDFNNLFIDVIGFEDNYPDMTKINIEFLEKNNFIYIGRFGDIIMIHKKSKFINNINLNEISKFDCWNLQINNNLEKELKNEFKIYNKIIGFHSNQLCERGTDVAIYDYAYYNQKLYGNKSIIFYYKHAWNNDSNVIKKFEKEFICYAYDKFSEIDQIILDEKIDYLYNQKSGSKSDNQLVTNCPNLIHAVFNVDPHGEKYATISKQLSSKYNNIVDYIPYMINLPSCNDNIRSKLNIPSNAIVIGRIGGFYQFDIEMAHRAIRKIVELDSKIIFLLVNTNKFYEHPQIIFLDKIIEPIEKVKFINSCDAMIHARSDGETFGLAVAEFSSLNKPVITCVSSIDNSHIEILSEKAIIYNTEDRLIDIFKNIRTIIKSRDDWNAYKEFTPEKVMEKFYTVFDLN